MTTINNKYYEAPTKSIWQGRTGPYDDRRLHQVVEVLDLSKSSIKDINVPSLIMLGFCSDEGVKRNLGRPGAALGPNALKAQLAKLPYLGDLTLYDIGNIKCIDENLEKAQQELGYLIRECHQYGHKTLVFGGGHETAWGHYLGLAPHYDSLGFFNFDAHFDLRTDHQSTSGTPFLQIAEHQSTQKKDFNYFCYGIQRTANTQDLFRKADSLNVTYLTAADITKRSIEKNKPSINKFIKQCDMLYVSICMDVFNGAIAPGVSAPAPLGLMPWHILPILNQLLSSKKVVSIDIVELSPPFDRDCQTARLASSIAAEVIYSL